MAGRPTEEQVWHTNDVLGAGEKHSKQLRILNRIISSGGHGITYEADPRHAEIIIHTIAVTKSVLTSGSRDDAAKDGPPVIESTSSTPVPEFYHDGHLYKIGRNDSKGQDYQEPQAVIFEDQNDQLIGGDKYMDESEASQF